MFPTNSLSEIMDQISRKDGAISKCKISQLHKLERPMISQIFEKISEIS